MSTPRTSLLVWGRTTRPIHPLRLAGAVREMMSSDTVLTFDAGDFVQWSRTLLPG